MTRQKCFQKVLVANRGEIAARLIRGANEAGYKTVAIYSSADVDAPYLPCVGRSTNSGATADESVCIGGPAVSESYLSIEKILDAARCSGADAIHPGYGFLAENATFAQVCRDAGIVFIGPSADAIQLMGNKRQAKIAMRAAGVPCVPGYEGVDQSDQALLKEARKMGFPVMIKAADGGGGRGMRLAHSESEFFALVNSAKNEALSAFGSDELILEKALIGPRHIEIQIVADRHGNVVYLGERDCSIQRRHQKVVEEAPSPFVDEALRRRMGETAVLAARACNYESAGTVEFLVDAERKFYFLEMNTRLQVEHPVTECISGVDLVAWQLDIAQGLPLPLAQEQVTLQGHAIEVRLYAEDPAADFCPQTGQIALWSAYEGEGIRIDSGFESGMTVSSYYDAMLAKLIAYGQNREEARRRLLKAIDNSVLLGVNSNLSYLSQIVSHPLFVQGEVTTAFIEQAFHKNDGTFAHRVDAKGVNAQTLAIAALCQYRMTVTMHSEARIGWRNTSMASCNFRFSDNAYPAQHYLVALDCLDRAEDSTAESYRVRVEGLPDDQIKTIELTLTSASRQGALGQLSVIANGLGRNCHYHAGKNARGLPTLNLKNAGRYLSLTDLTHQSRKAAQMFVSGKVYATMDGLIVETRCKLGERVTAGQTLVVLEAMKMEHQLKADCDGAITALHVVAGDQVKIRQHLVEIEPVDSKSEV